MLCVKGELAKQHKTMMKDLPQGCTKLPEGSGLLDNLFNFFTHYFTFKQDACLEFYEHIFVDPIVKVSPMEVGQSSVTVVYFVCVYVSVCVCACGCLHL